VLVADALVAAVEINLRAGRDFDGAQAEPDGAVVDLVQVDETRERRSQIIGRVIAQSGWRLGRRKPRAYGAGLEKPGLPESGRLPCADRFPQAFRQPG